MEAIREFGGHTMGKRGWDYSALSIEKNKWYPVIQRGGDHFTCEISVCHSSHPHGFISWGWYDQNKILIYEANHDDDAEDKVVETWKKIFEDAKERAVLLAHTLNTK